MRELALIRKRRGWSQRQLAARAGVSFRTVQMLEAGLTDPRLSSLERIAVALGMEPGSVTSELWRMLAEEPESVQAISRNIARDGEASWKIWVFEFVDAFRRAPAIARVARPPVPELSDRLRALLAATVETLCHESALPPPWWVSGVGPLALPWFVAGIENLKCSALVESPVAFRQRNIFVLGNFLSRA